MVEMRDNGAESKGLQDRADSELARSIYLPLLRGVVPKSLAAFDPVSQTLVTGKRDATTVPTQALFFLNSSFVREESLSFAANVKSDARSQEDKVRDLYLRTLGRPASESEVARAKDFLGDFAGTWQPETPPDSGEQQTLAVNTTDGGTAAGDVAVNPDDMPRNDLTAVEKGVVATDAETAAWMNFIQALYASAEFRFVR